MLLLPHHLEFAETLANLPFFYQQMASETCEVMHVIQSSANCLPEIATTDRLQEYLLGGEIDETVEYIDGYADADDFEEDNNLLDLELSDEWLGSI
ncbi:hypothetical protein [Microcoleus sp.]|uniref:hypothetical protein n=1 Tax=Microcoleus sp. TaxID=44472 RepID=UPI00403E5D2B